LLHEIKGYEHQEIARILRCSVGNSKSQLHKAKLKMRELLGYHKNEILQEAIEQRTTKKRRAKSERARTFDQSAPAPWETFEDELADSQPMFPMPTNSTGLMAETGV
jgi:hypothetical protein